MNLHNIVRGAITSINPDITAVLRASTGYTKDSAGKRTPSYADTAAQVQVQALTGKDLEQMNGLNIQGVFRSVHLNGNWNGVVRASQKGGDLLLFPQAPGEAASTWMVVAVLESWPDWTRLAVWLQQPSI